MKLVLFLSFVLMLPFAGCQRDKMNSKNLTTVNVKRSLPASLSGNTVSLDTIRQNPSRDNNNTTIASNVKISPSRQETGKQQGTEQNIKKTNTRSYHIIVASHPRENLAEKDVTQLKPKVSKTHRSLPKTSVIVSVLRITRINRKPRNRGIYSPPNWDKAIYGSCFINT